MATVIKWGYESSGLFSYAWKGEVGSPSLPSSLTHNMRTHRNAITHTNEWKYASEGLLGSL